MVLMGRAAHIGFLSQLSDFNREVFDQCLQKIGIGRLKKRSFCYLSGGEQQLVLIARALTQESRFLIMDEPTSGLDFRNQFLVLDSITALCDQGYNIIFSTHHPGQIKK